MANQKTAGYTWGSWALYDRFLSVGFIMSADIGQIGGDLGFRLARTP